MCRAHIRERLARRKRHERTGSTDRGKASVDVMEPGAAKGRDIAKGEGVEHEITAFIEKRHTQRVRDEGDRAGEEAWMKSESRRDDRRRAENRAAWYDWHMDQAERHGRNLAALVAQHEAAAERLMQATDERRTA
jgi:hypothetical protein